MTMDNDMRFCTKCDYATTTTCLNRSRFDLPCPRCGNENLIGNVYKLGSKTHRQRRQLWELGEVKGSPLPYKEPPQ